MRELDDLSVFARYNYNLLTNASSDDSLLLPANHPPRTAASRLSSAGPIPPRIGFVADLNLDGWPGYALRNRFALLTGYQVNLTRLLQANLFYAISATSRSSIPARRDWNQTPQRRLSRCNLNPRNSASTPPSPPPSTHPTKAFFTYSVAQHRRRCLRQLQILTAHDQIPAAIIALVVLAVAASVSRRATLNRSHHHPRGQSTSKSSPPSAQPSTRHCRRNRPRPHRRAHRRQLPRATAPFADQTLARLGANTLFSFERGTRSLDLENGSILLQVPKDAGGATIRSAPVVAAITGTTVMMEYSPGNPGTVKLIVLEGTVRLSLPDASANPSSSAPDK